MTMQQKNAIFNEDCDVREWEADDFVLIGVCMHKQLNFRGSPCEGTQIVRATSGHQEDGERGGP